MTKKKVGICLSVMFTLLLCFGILAGCASAPKTTYMITVMSGGEKVLPDIKVCVYKDGTMENLVWAAETDEEGNISFEAEQSENYVAVLEKVPDGYQVEESYQIKEGQTEIKLERVLTDSSDLTNVTYELGDKIHDFEVTAIDGTEYKLSELLKEKKAVVLNFWYVNCEPCKIEFPYLQEAYTQYVDDIEVLAINPVGDTEAKITALAQENELTFPMAAGEDTWNTCMKLTAYPTTVVIDRYGTIAMIHKGMVTDTETFTKVFGFFTSEDYEQTIIKNIEDIK